jgi:methionine aminopeptidase
VAPNALLAADFNGDGKRELIAGNSTGARVGVRLGIGDGALQAAVSLATATTPRSVAAADFNGAGTHEVAELDGECTIVTMDHALSAHFEHTIAVTEDEPEILTR